MTKTTMRHILLSLLLLSALPLCAVPIIYTATLYDGVPVAGTIYQPNGQPSNPVGAVYYSFFANAGASVTVTGARLSGPYDMAFWVLQGLFADTDVFGGDLASLGYIDIGDDELPPNLPGPFGDPRSTFIAPSTGFYTVAVTNFASGGTPPYDFLLTATGISEAAIPEPGTLGLAAIGLLALLAIRRR